MGEFELLRKLGSPFLKVRDHDRELLQRVGPQPGREVRLNRHPARLANLGDLGRHEDRPGLKIHGLGLELGDFSLWHPWTDAGKQAEREIRDPPSTLEALKVLHELTCLGCGKSDRYSPSAPDSV